MSFLPSSSSNATIFLDQRAFKYRKEHLSISRPEPEPKDLKIANIVRIAATNTRRTGRGDVTNANSI